MDFQGGETLLFNKPKGWTSFDVVKKIRNTIKIKKVGHAGTLDPLATGLLILCTGKHTKRISQIQEQEKVYRVLFRLGATTPSYDAEFPPENLKDTSHIRQSDVVEILPQFRGNIKQIPPLYSAVKVKGQRAYKAARAGKSLELKPRIVSVYEFALEAWESPESVQALVRCSKGTYIRSLIHDVGQTLGVGAYILELERIQIGEFLLADAWKIEDFVREFKS
ncbi:MAG: tRNA pseudouridine(55) synthase TruB [Bacteroidota bacterium]